MFDTHWASVMGKISGCTTYCLGPNIEVQCNTLSDLENKICIKACLDCQNPRDPALFCDCPWLYSLKRLKNENTIKKPREVSDVGNYLIVAAILIGVLVFLCGIAFIVCSLHRKLKNPAAVTAAIDPYLFELQRERESVVETDEDDLYAESESADDLYAETIVKSKHTAVKSKMIPVFVFKSESDVSLAHSKITDLSGKTAKRFS